MMRHCRSCNQATGTSFFLREVACPSGLPAWQPSQACGATQVEKPGPTVPLAEPQASFHRSCLCSLSLTRCGRCAKHTCPLALHTAWQHNYLQDLPSPHGGICRSSAAATLLLLCCATVAFNVPQQILSLISSHVGASESNYLVHVS